MSALFNGPNTSALKDDSRLTNRRSASPWLHAWHDPVANLCAYTGCMRLCDIYGDGDSKLLIADADRKLKIYKGTSLLTEVALLDVPAALACFYPSLAQPAIPSVAVAAGSYIFIYRNLRPYYKFTLPPIEIDNSEQEVWNNLRSSKLQHNEGIDLLVEARDKGVQLTSRSQTLLALPDAKDRSDFIDSQKHLPLVQLSVVTCMEVLRKNSQEDPAVSMLVVGTECKKIYILDPEGTQILKTLELPAVPVFIAVSGTYDVDYRIVVSCRNGNLYSIKKGKVLGTVIELETQSNGLVLLEKSILVSCMDGVIHSFHFKGKKNFSIYLNETITNMVEMHVKRGNIRLLLVATANGEVRIYNKKHLISSFRPSPASAPALSSASPSSASSASGGDVVTALRFGAYGREDATLALVFRSRSLSIKILSRHAKLDVSTAAPGPPAEQDIPLNVPKKTKLYVEQTQRERDQCIDMHRIFQRDLCKLRLNTARNFVQVITSGAGPLSSIGSTSLKLDAKVFGLGPIFQLRFSLKNTGAKPVLDVPVSVVYNKEIYRVRNALKKFEVLIPALEYMEEMDIECIDPATGMSEPLKVMVCNPKSVVPVIAATVNMPISEILEGKEDA